MNRFLRFFKKLFYSIPFGLKAADAEIMGGNTEGDGNDTVMKQQINDMRVARHLLKGEVTQEVEELRYRTYKVGRASDNYEYIGSGMAVKQDAKEKATGTIKFTQENKPVCNDILTELNRVNSYGVEKYSIHIDYNTAVRFKFEEFIRYVDVVIEEGKKAVAVLRFDDIRNPSQFNSKPFIGELEKVKTLFSKKDAYGLSRNDFVTSMVCMNFITFNASDDEPDIISYSFSGPTLIGVEHVKGEFRLKYEWDEYFRVDLTDKFFNAELEEKYKNKAKKEINVDNEILDKLNEEIKCSKCGKSIKIVQDGYLIDSKTSEPVCLECYKKSLLNDVE